MSCMNIFTTLENSSTKVKHPCKMLVVSVLDPDRELDESVVKKVLSLIEG